MINQITKEQLKKLEKKNKSKKEQIFDLFLSFLPLASYVVSVLEYLFIKDKYNNDFKYRYIIFLTIIIVL